MFPRALCVVVLGEIFGLHGWRDLARHDRLGSRRVFSCWRRRFEIQFELAMELVVELVLVFAFSEEGLRKSSCVFRV